MKYRTNKLKHPESLRRTKDDFVVRHIRGSGPGGQHRNKVSTGVRITDKITGLCAEATDSKSQKSNRDSAFRKLFLKLLSHYESESREADGHSMENQPRIRTYHEVRGTVKDHRTGEVRDLKKVLDGDLLGFGIE